MKKKKALNQPVYKPDNKKMDAWIEKLIASAVNKFRILNKKVIILEMPNNVWYVITDSIFYRLIEYENRRDHFVFKKVYNMYGHMHKSSSPELAPASRQFCVKFSKNIKNALENHAKSQNSQLKEVSHNTPVSFIDIENNNAIDNPDNLAKIIVEDNEDVVLEENSSLDNIVNNLLEAGEITPEQLNQL